MGHDTAPSSDKAPGAFFFTRKTLLLAVCVALHVATILIPTLREASFFLSPVLDLKLPLLTFGSVVLAVVYARGGDIVLKGKGMTVEMREKDLRATHKDEWDAPPVPVRKKKIETT